MIAPMVNDSRLASGERVIFSAHSHWKNLVGPVLVTLAAVGAVVFGLTWLVPSPEDQAWQRWTILAVATLLTLVFGLWPFLGWLASTDTLTTRRLISRRGVLSREGKDLPIDRVQSVSYRRSVLDRMLGCGTLIVQTAGETSDVELYDVAHIERRILQVQEILLDEQIPAEGTVAPGSAAPERPARPAGPPVAPADGEPTA
ncbi:MAG TPA: PH domain-containing protein [Actinotalea sp.]|nr:PH domain-containing protein [Actinotalea sp.]HRA50099.1 PH domain-containing protein [Actinotalea sp.]